MAIESNNVDSAYSGLLIIVRCPPGSSGANDQLCKSHSGGAHVPLDIKRDIQSALPGDLMLQLSNVRCDPIDVPTEATIRYSHTIVDQVF